jgi:hypothetical protein
MRSNCPALDHEVSEGIQHLDTLAGRRDQRIPRAGAHSIRLCGCPGFIALPRVHRALPYAKLSSPLQGSPAMKGQRPDLR